MNTAKQLEEFFEALVKTQSLCASMPSLADNLDNSGKKEERELVLPQSPQIRASQVGDLFVDARKKGELSETTKKLVYRVIADRIGAASQFNSIYVEKGTIVESESIEYINSVKNSNYAKNVNKYVSEILVGTPDIITDNEVIDIKNSFEIETHLHNIMQNELPKQYYYQLQAYMALVNRDVGKIIYVLMPTPQHILEKQARALEYKYADYQSALDALISANEKISQLPDNIRIKEITVVREQNFIDEFTTRYEMFKEYYLSVCEQLKIKTE